MFEIVKANVNLLSEIERDLNVTFRQEGEKNWRIDGDEVESCPFCNHHGCFKVCYVEGDNVSSFYKCFSCGEYGDVITWRSKHKDIPAKDAALELARENNLKLPSDYNPVQQVFNLAALYYSTCLTETCNRPFPELSGKTPRAFQLEVRCHSEETLKTYQIGWSDGGLVSYLQGIGVDEEIIDQSGLRNAKTGKDFLPVRCFIYPHYVKGRVSHFTFKDPLKKVAYQLPKKNSLNGYVFYGQDTVSKSDVIALVEGENDWLSVMESGQSPATLATIGQLSKEQMDWLRTNCADKKILTLFDPDDAGNKYREKLEGIRKSFKGMTHVMPPEGKDIDRHLADGADLDKLVINNRITVTAPPPTQRVVAQEIIPSPLTIPWEVVDAPVAGAYVPPIIPSSGSAVSTGTETEGKVIESEDGSVIQRYGCYWKVKANKDGASEYVRISDFYIELKNVFLDEDGDRNREIILIRRDGYKSKPFFVNSEAKVSLKSFSVLVAKWGDCEWLGREPELAGMWRLVNARTPSAEIHVPRRVGKHTPTKGWIFKNVFITETGASVLPDEDGIFWIEGKKVGVRPQGLSDTEDPEDKQTGIPELELSLSDEETDKLLKGFIQNFALNTGEMGLVIMSIAWAWANVYSDMIFKMNGGMCMLMFWGPHGDGKTTLAKWIHSLYGFDTFGYTQTSQLRSAVGWMRQAEYYSSLPMILDEVRNNEDTTPHFPMIRSWYDRSGRVMGVKESFGVQTRKIRSNLFLAGEDLPDDPATKERCVILRIPKNNREKQVSFEWCKNNKHLFSAIGYKWIKDSCVDPIEPIISGIKEIDRELMAAGCSARISKNWAAVGYFGKKLSDKFAPDFNFMEFMKKSCREEYAQQAKDSTLIQFFELIAIAMAQEHPKVTSNHILKDGNFLHIWFIATHKEVMDQCRGSNKFSFSKNMILRAIKDEEWYVSDHRKITMGIGQNGVRRTVLTLDWTKAPDIVKSIAGEE